MSRLKLGMRLCLPLLLLSAASTVNAATLYVNCGGKTGLTSIGAALKVLQYSESHGPTTISVSGACHENVVIQSIDRLTLNAVNNASITDASSGTLDAIIVSDSRDVTIAGFSITGGAAGIECSGGTLCLLNNDTVQGAASGIAVLTLGRAHLSAVKLNNNDIGLLVNHGGTVFGDATMQGNNRGIHMVLGAVLNIAATVTQSQELGVFGAFNSTLDCSQCVITNNAAGGVLLRENSSARFLDGFTITSNGGAGVSLNESSSALFGVGTVAGNAGGTDVFCGPQFASARGATATNIGGGTTNCSQPSP